MFIKFGDKTKKIIVKKSKKKYDSPESEEENAIYIHSDDENDRRIRILKKYTKNQEKE